ncbi:MAG TPA: iron-containing redox enzyme family protein [Candidatus Nanoarchaeia archaeon]|nr:iron-containing redox enzyme family protein [Candidatus Nanoarchaeia archaeon]
MTGHQFLKELQEELKNHLAVTHSFLDKIKDLNNEQLKIFASQFYLYVRMFPRLMGAVVYNVPDEVSRLPLILNLINECGGLKYLEKLDSSHTHPALFRRFTKKLGIKDKDLENTKPLLSTKQFIDVYEKLYLKSPPLKSIGAVGPGTECIVPIMYIPILEGLRKQKKFTEDDLYFFSLHLPVDEEHCEMICKTLTNYMDDKKNQKLVRDGALEVLTARKKFWDGLSKEILR